MANNRPTKEPESGLHVFAADELAQVVSLAEACYMWGYSKSYVRRLLIEGKVDGRKTLTGGSYLVSVPSMIRYKGKPKLYDLWRLKIKEGE